ncbi:MAG: OmpA family protein [Spirochaetia bacterium]|nr:OmpA family protein [Spirochaetia bacterium]
MNLKEKIRLGALFIMMFSLLFCGSTQEVKEPEKEPEPQAATKDVSGEVAEMNKKLKQLSVLGFGYKGSNIGSDNYGEWVKKSVPVFKDLLQKLPPGYILQITGHTDAKGPEEPQGKKEGNIALSEKRARYIYDALKKYGIDDPAIKYKGAGSAELKNKNAPNAAENRRVTFMIVPDL